MRDAHKIFTKMEIMQEFSRQHTVRSNVRSFDPSRENDANNTASVTVIDMIIEL